MEDCSQREPCTNCFEFLPLVPESWLPDQEMFKTVLCLSCFKKAFPNEHIHRARSAPEKVECFSPGGNDKFFYFLRSHFVVACQELFFKILTQKLSFEAPLAKQMSGRMAFDYLKCEGFDMLDFAQQMAPFYWIQERATKN